MGAGTEAYAKAAGITRARQDELAAMSHQRACIATKEGRLAGEIVPVTVRQRREELVVDTDEGIRSETTVDGLGRLKPAFSPDGTITAGNASQISDGAAAVVVMSRAKADELGLSPLAELVGFGLVAGPTRPCSPSRRGPSGRSSTAPAATSPTSTGSRSTRRSRRWRPRPSTTSASATTWSTSTAGPSPSATPSACRAPAW